MRTPTGILLSNLGTPEAPTASAVRPYLRQFLTDPRVIDIPWLPRQLLVRCIIAPFRAPRSARAYATVWTPEGSPLKIHSTALVREVASLLGAEFRVSLGMRYGKPSLETSLRELLDQGCEDIRLLPLYPQNAEATTGSTRVEFERLARRIAPNTRIETIPAFPELPGFIEAQAALFRSALDSVPADGRHVLFSYHGLPERQVRRADPTGTTCLASPSCCDVLGEANRSCYRAQCHATSRALAHALKLSAGTWTTSFQSRLGRIPWIGPHTDAVALELAARKTRHLVVATPSFVTDCLETLEEIGHGLRKSFLDAGGESFTLIPCVNTHPQWVKAVAELARTANA